MTTKKILPIIILIAIVVGVIVLVTQSQKRAIDDTLMESDTSHLSTVLINSESDDTEIPGLSTTYVTLAGDWPPQVVRDDAPYHCVPSDNIYEGGAREEREIDGRTVCVTYSTEGAAGSSYATYHYMIATDGGTASTAVTLRSAQCGAFDDAERKVCENEQATFAEEAGFDVDQVAMMIFATKDL